MLTASSRSMTNGGTQHEQQHRAEQAGGQQQVGAL